MPRIIIADSEGQQREVDQSAYNAGFFPGWAYVGPAPTGSPTGYDTYMDAAVAAVVGSSSSSTSGALRAAYGPSVMATQEQVAVGRDPRVSQYLAQMPGITWSTGVAPTSVDEHDIGYWTGGTPAFALKSPLPVRFVNAPTAAINLDQTYGLIGANYNGSATPGPLVQEFTATTDRVILNLNPVVNGALGGAGNIEIWIDNRRLTVPVPSAAAAQTAKTAWNMAMTWPVKGTHTIGVSLSLVSMAFFWTSAGDATAATTAPTGGPRLLVQGDSWIEGQTYAPVGLGRLLARYLGVQDAAVAGQGGTGYINTGPAGQGKTVYGSSDRRTGIVNANPTDIVILGSMNDDGASGIQAAAAAHYSALASALPSARLFVVLPQPSGSGATASAGHVANVAAVKAAAQAASNVTAIIDMSDWLTGVGTAADRRGDGNRDLFLGPDGGHLTDAGVRYFAARLAEILQRWLYQPIS